MCTASATARNWNRQRLQILADADKLAVLADELARGTKSDPAGVRDLRAALRSLRSAPPHFCWASDGTFADAVDASKADWLAGPDGRPFNFSTILAILNGARDAAARECALRAFREAVRPKAAARHPEIGPLLERLDVDPKAFEVRPRPKEPRPEPPPEPPAAILTVARRSKLEEARRILMEADRRWDELADEQSPALYRRLLREYPETLRDLQAVSRVHNRAGR